MKRSVWTLLMLATAVPLAHAELGGKATEAVIGKNRIRAVRNVTPSQAYSIRETTTDDGGTIREYSLPTGEVFGVAWTGPRMPNLQKLFGIYFQTYREALAERIPGRRPVRIDRSDLVVQSGGHMRAFQGRAYLPPLVPAGMPIDEIK